jgi:low temperature requirement protein LtrA
MPMVMGMIVSAAAYELLLTEPSASPTPAGTALILLGPALFPARLTLFQWAFWRVVVLSQVAAIAALVLMLATGLPVPRGAH